MQNIKKNSTKAGAGVSAFVSCLSLSLAVVAMYTLTTVDAHAGAKLCNYMVQQYNGGLGRAVATLGILIIGIAAAMGRVSATTAIIVALGCVLLGNVNGTVGDFGNPGGTTCWN